MNRQTTTAWLVGLFLVAFASAGWAEPPPTDPKSRLAKAETMFTERCKTAGEFIHRTVESIEGIFLMKLRPKEINYGDQFRMDDPYGRDLGGDGYILTFIRGSFDANNSRSQNTVTPPYAGYPYVEAIDPADGKRYRYTGSTKVVGRKNPNTPNHQTELKRNPNFDLNNYAFVLDKVPAPGETPRYGVTYDDISTRQEREYWIAGSSLRVIDLKTNEVIAERIGYMLDRGQGNKSGGRAPWLLAADNACPEFAPRHGSSAQRRQTQVFVEKVLKPKGGD